MKPKQEAKELYNKFSERIYPNFLEPHKNTIRHHCLICVDEKFNGIIYVLGELKARKELSEKIYLKALNDLNQEREEVKQEINKL